MKFTKIGIFAAIAAMATGGGVIQTAQSLTNSIDHQQQNLTNAKVLANKNASAKAKKQTQKRAERSNYHSNNYWLMPVNKESFKQAQRKQIKKRSVRKAKRNGQV